MESAANFAPLRPADFANLSIFTFNLEKMTPGDFFYTGTACGACEKYEVCNNDIFVMTIFFRNETNHPAGRASLLQKGQSGKSN